MIESIDYGTQTIEFEVQRKKACKNTYITVERDIGVVVKTNIDISLEALNKRFNSRLVEFGMSTLFRTLF